MNEALLAEDEPVSRYFLSEALALLDWRCSAASDGDAALALAQRRRFDLLVLDLNLPNISGPELLARLRADPAAASRDAPALALSADPDPELDSRLRLRGFAAVGRKPITVEALGLLIDASVEPTSPDSAPDASRLPTWDDAAALRAGGGQVAIVEALRELMRRELPMQRERINDAFARDDRSTLRAELHRLKAACGFCGAAALSEAIDQVHHESTARTPVPRALQDRLLTAIDRVLAGDGPAAT
jgi:CheY-like chemotaxis protein